MLRVIGYIRVSTEEQAKSGVSLETQRCKLEQYAQFKDIDLVRVIMDDGYSAKDMKRPGMVELTEAMRTREADGVAIYKLDRLTRSLRDWSHLIDEFFGERCGQQLFSVTDDINTTTAAGRLVLNVLMSVAQWEREINGERTKENLATHIGKGLRTGRGTRFGYRLDLDGPLSRRGRPVQLVEDPVQQEALRRIKDLVGRGESLRAACRMLEEMGIATVTGKTIWTPCSVAKILKRTG